MAYVRDTLPSLLASWGYATLFVDSFSTRNVEPNCIKEHASVDRLADAYGGLFYLARLPFVDHKRVGVVGVSLGGKTALFLSDPQTVDQVANPEKLTFKAGVAFYPPCNLWHETSAISCLADDRAAGAVHLR
jgi:dienelactone hydrolase